MIKAFYNATAGANSNQIYLDVISNNMANLQTTGYKSMKAEFSDLLYTNMQQGEPNSIMVGSGSKADKTDTLFGQGTLMQTGKETDYAILGDGFFAVQDENAEEVLYTRSGAFTVGNIDEENYLMLGNRYVLNSDEEPIVLPPNATDGEEIDLEDYNVIPAVFQFTNNFDLEKIGDSLFRIANENAEFFLDEQPQLRAGALEASNVDLAQEMVDIIKAQRAFQFNSRIIQIADELEQTVNSLKS